jgi:uncharacterized SAM-binding protein YcdF (DUF218 family)
MTCHIIIVLGNSRKEIRDERVNRAIEYYNQINKKVSAWDEEYDTYLVFSGGNNGALKMKEYALKIGIWSKYILTEENSKNTNENIEFSKKLIEQKFIYKNDNYIKDITICTSAFHLQRSIIIANRVLGQYKLNFICPNEEFSLERAIKEYNSILQMLASDKELRKNKQKKTYWLTGTEQWRIK